MEKKPAYVVKGTQNDIFKASSMKFFGFNLETKNRGYK